MTLALALVLLLGPPKLPPLPGRGMPAPAVQPEPPSEPAPPPADPAPTKSPAPTTTTRVPPPAPPPPPPTAAAPPPTTTAARAPTSSPPATITDAVFPDAKPTPKSGAATRSAGAATPLRLVSQDEVAGWDAEERRAKAFAPKGSTTPEQSREDIALRRTATPEPTDERLTFRRSPRPPKRSAAFVLGYRFFRVQDALGRAQDWHVASLEVSPLRRYVRINFITEFGIEGGPAARAGDRADILLMERLGLGAQYPGVVTPFVEFQGGVGGARLEMFGRNDLALLYGLGLDAGAQWAVTRWMYLHAAIGWIRPTFVLPDRSSSFDRVAFKLGIGF